MAPNISRFKQNVEKISRAVFSLKEVKRIVMMKVWCGENMGLALNIFFRQDLL